MVPSEAYAHAGGLGLPLFHEGRETADAIQFSKKKIMKTKNTKLIEGLPVNTANRVPDEPSQAAAPKQDSRLPIDSEARKTNRTFPTEKVLALLQQQDRRLWELAEVVGKWIWVSFSEQPAPTVRQTLAQLGFHWNRTRQAWQHPCGQFRLSSSGDPHEKYQAYHPADVTTN